MEKREILGIIIAAVGICLLIGIIRMVKGEDVEQDSSIATAPRQVVITDPEKPSTTTDYWDYVRELQSAASSSGSENTGTDINQNDGVELITEAGFAGQTPAGSDDLRNGVVTIMPEQALTTTTTLTTAAPPFFVNVQ